MSDASEVAVPPGVMDVGQVPWKRETGFLLDVLRWCDLDLSRDFGRKELPHSGSRELACLYERIASAMEAKAKGAKSAAADWSGQTAPALHSPMTWRRERGILLKMVPWCRLDLKRDLGMEDLLSTRDDEQIARVCDRIAQAIRAKTKNEKARLERRQKGHRSENYQTEIFPAQPGHPIENVPEFLGIDILVDRMVQAEERLVAAGSRNPMDDRKIFGCALWVFETRIQAPGIWLQALKTWRDVRKTWLQVPHAWLQVLESQLEELEKLPGVRIPIRKYPEADKHRAAWYARGKKRFEPENSPRGVVLGLLQKQLEQALPSVEGLAAILPEHGQISRRKR